MQRAFAIKRRDVLIGLAGSILPTYSIAQQTKIWHVGILAAPAVTGNTIVLGLIRAFKSELSAFGYEEGRNLKLTIISADGYYERLPALAKDLVGANPDVIVAMTTPAIAAAQKETTRIPIIMTPATDPIKAGFISSLAKPGGNITGLANMYPDLTAKSFEIIQQLLPEVFRVGIVTSNNPSHADILADAVKISNQLQIELTHLHAATPDDVDLAFDLAVEKKCQIILVIADPTRPAILAAAERIKIPTLYQQTGYVRLGGLISYGPELLDLFRRAAYYADRILKGHNPGEIPVEQPTKLRLTINMKTAGVLNLNISPNLLARADEIID
ncbi:ABC transporter substrate-binding protein [Methylobacterium mesophilicum]|uniref:ABC transporter substrate-binding protein n=1 Tax=Methylobacterium mesophilicum TaxID=39956 RepID=UPI0002C60954|nr:ABC transporter substrate-binding protein [Methylobacterium mesophilicum]